MSSLDLTFWTPNLPIIYPVNPITFDKELFEILESFDEILEQFENEIEIIEESAVGYIGIDEVVRSL